MSDYAWLSVANAENYTGLADLLDEAFEPHEVAARLRDAIHPAATGILIEHGYVDKDYRSTYYKYYAKKGRTYRDDCVRLHFFDSTVSFGHLLADIRLEDEPLPHGKSQVDEYEAKLSPHYFG